MFPWGRAMTANAGNIMNSDHGCQLYPPFPCWLFVVVVFKSSHGKTLFFHQDVSLPAGSHLAGVTPVSTRFDGFILVVT